MNTNSATFLVTPIEITQNIYIEIHKEHNTCDVDATSDSHLQDT
jgi:hypothetical protein